MVNNSSNKKSSNEKKEDKNKKEEKNKKKNTDNNSSLNAQNEDQNTDSNVSVTPDNSDADSDDSDSTSSPTMTVIWQATSMDDNEDSDNATNNELLPEEIQMLEQCLQQLNSNSEHNEAIESPLFVEAEDSDADDVNDLFVSLSPETTEDSEHPTNTVNESLTPTLQPLGSSNTSSQIPMLNYIPHGLIVSNHNQYHITGSSLGSTPIAVISASLPSTPNTTPSPDNASPTNDSPSTPTSPSIGSSSTTPSFVEMLNDTPTGISLSTLPSVIPPSPFATPTTSPDTASPIAVIVTPTPTATPSPQSPATPQASPNEQEVAVQEVAVEEVAMNNELMQLMAEIANEIENEEQDNENENENDVEEQEANNDNSVNTNAEKVENSKQTIETEESEQEVDIELPNMAFDDNYCIIEEVDQTTQFTQQPLSDKNKEKENSFSPQFYDQIYSMIDANNDDNTVDAKQSEQPINTAIISDTNNESDVQQNKDIKSEPTKDESPIKLVKKITNEKRDLKNHRRVSSHKRRGKSAYRRQWERPRRRHKGYGNSLNRKKDRNRKRRPYRVQWGRNLMGFDNHKPYEKKK